METGLKKLWTRRKSKGIEGHTEPALKGLRTVQSTDRKGLLPPKTQDRSIKRPAENISNQSGRPATTDPNKKVQPTLLGISRPTTSPSRPGTSGSGSLLTAVNRAADAVSIAEQDFQQTAQDYTRNHVATKAPRYVDIFSLSNPDSPKVYNEDIAERNLDLVRVALDGSEAPLSPSKYQEDVAARNAFPPLPGENHDFVSPSQHRFHSATDQPLNGARPMTSALDNQSLSKLPPHAPPITSDNRPQSASPSHFRQYSDQSRGSQYRGLLPKAGKQPGGATTLPPRGTVPDTFHVSSAGSPRSNRSTVPPSRPLFGAHVAQASSHEVFRGENLRNYVRSQSELIQSRSQGDHQPTPSNTTRFVDGQDGTQQSDQSIRSPSALSNTSSVKRSINRPHRTIMDLTGEDSEVFSERTSTSFYSTSPVVENAKADPLRRFQPAIVSQTTKSNTIPRPHQPNGSIDSHGQEKTPNSLVADNVQPLPAEDELPVEKKPVPRIKKAVSTSAFSPINTLAHVEPRRSVLIEPQGASTQSDSGRQDLTIKEEADHTSEKPNSAALHANRTFGHENSVTEPKQHESHSTEHDIAGPRVQVGPVLDSRGASAPAAEAEIVEHDIKQAAEPPPSETIGATESPQSRSNIQTTPDSLHSIDFVDPSRAFGVTTRDFATTPTKPPLESVPEDNETNPSVKPKRPGTLSAERRAASYDTGSRKQAPVPAPKLVRSTSTYSSTFDEDEFAHKQAEARAALIRLQQSLDENFLTHPIPQPAPHPSRTLRHHSSLSDGKPVAPSAIFAQVRNTSPSPADYRLSVATSTSSEETKPTPSYHTLTTVAKTNGLSQSRNSYSSSGSADHSPQHSKSKSKYAVDPNGPGPSVIDDDRHQVKHPLPLPPPLHLNGITLYRTLHQNAVPPSPGEISLSSFPLPSSSPRQSFNPGSNSSELAHHHPSHHSHQSSAGTGRILRRQSSQRSQASSASAFSIPYHMIPDRSSSARDRLVREDTD